MSLSCGTCPSLGGSEDSVRFFGKNFGVPLCVRFGKILGKPGINPSAQRKLMEVTAASCDSHGKERLSTPLRAEFVVAFPDADALTPVSEEVKTRCTTCQSCSNMVRDTTVATELGWPSALCAAKGKLVPPTRFAHEARGCEYRRHGTPRSSVLGVQLLPEFDEAFRTSVDPIQAFIRGTSRDSIDPTEYPTDRPVEEADEAVGIRAWQKIPDPAGYGEDIFLPIYDIEKLPESLRAIVPRSGDDEHPELYIDHQSLTYQLGVMWMHLDETPALWGEAGTGKGHPVTTKVATPDGWRHVGDLKTGDLVIGQNGQPTLVTGVFPRGTLPVNRVTMNDGSSVLVDDDHLWSVQTRKQEQDWRTSYPRNNWQTVSTRRLKKRGLWTKHVKPATKFRIPQVMPVQYGMKQLPIEPYTLGVLIANGSLTSNEAIFSTNDENVVARVREDLHGDRLKAHGQRWGGAVGERTPTPTRRWVFHDGTRGGVWGKLDSLRLANKLAADKFIPQMYLLSDELDRRALLAGLMDCDGSVSADGRRTAYYTMSKHLAKNVRELVMSLGGTASISQDERDGLYVVAIAMSECPFSTPEKVCKWNLTDHRIPSRRIVSIEEYGEAEVVCISVASPDQLYVTEDYIVTHNTEAFRYMAWRMALPFNRFSITGSSELDDLAGKMMFTPGRGTFPHYGHIPLAWQQPGVMCVDEPNTGPPDVWQFFRPLTDNSKQLILDMLEGERLDRHPDCYLGMAMNPSWDPRNMGTAELADADANRLMHVRVVLPPPEVERRIIQQRVHLDGWEMPASMLDTVMSIASNIRQLVENHTLPSMSWAIRQQIKVGRALRWFPPTLAYRRAIADSMEPERMEAILDQVRAQVEDDNPPWRDQR